MEQKKLFSQEKSSTPTGLVLYTNMAAVSLFWYTNMAAVTSCETLNYVSLGFRNAVFNPIYIHLWVNKQVLKVSLLILSPIADPKNKLRQCGASSQEPGHQ